MVLGKLPVPGRPTIWITVGQGPTALAVGAGGGCLDIFTLIYPFSPLSPSLWETARYRLKYCLKGPLNPKQPTNQIQSGFRHQRSTNDHLVRLETFIREAFIKKEHLVAVFFDLEKAYDTTWKYGIMNDLQEIGLKGRLPIFV